MAKRWDTRSAGATEAEGKEVTEAKEAKERKRVGKRTKKREKKGMWDSLPLREVEQKRTVFSPPGRAKKSGQSSSRWQAEGR